VSIQFVTLSSSVTFRVKMYAIDASDTRVDSAKVAFLHPYAANSAVSRQLT
jgi:hypothetical protein